MVLAAIVTAATALAEPAIAPSPIVPSLTHTLPLSPSVIALLAAAQNRSSIIGDLLDALERSDIVVYVADTMPAPLSGPTSYLSFLSNEAGARYLLVRLDRMRLSASERIVALGHELQHALEVAEAPEVRSARGLAQLYRRIGWESRPDRFETERAQTTGRRVRG